MTFDELVNAIATEVSASVVLVDRGLKLVAYSAQTEGVDTDRIRSILDRSCSADARAWFVKLGNADALKPFYLPSNPALGAGPRICIPVVDGETDVCGYLFLVPAGGIELHDMNIGACKPYADLAAIQLAGAELQRGRLSSALLTGLLGTPPEARLSLQLISEANWFPARSPFVMLAVSGAPSTLIPRTIAAPLGSYTAVLTALVGDPDTAIRELVRQYGIDGNLIGIGGTQEVLADIRSSWRQAELAIRVAENVPARGPVTRWDELGVYRLAGCGPSADIAGAVLIPPVRKLLTHRNPDLWRTALAYLEHAGDAAATSSTLEIHRQTLYYRLGKVNEVTGMSLADGEDRLLLHLGLTLGQFLVTDPPLKATAAQEEPSNFDSKI